jgi:periplasmic mercuric ion binding protein
MSRFVLSILTTAVVSLAPASATERTVTLAVENMTCELCPPIVKKSLARMPGVANADVSGEKHTATVVFDDQKTTVAALISATTNAGYPSRPVPEQ